MTIGLGDELVDIGHDVRPGEQACLGFAHHGGRGEHKGAVRLFVRQVASVTAELAK